MIASVFFLAPSRSGAELMQQYFEMVSRHKLTNVMAAATENDYFMISGDIEEDIYLTHAPAAMQSLSRIIGHMFSLELTDSVFRFYRIKML